MERVHLLDLLSEVHDLFLLSFRGDEGVLRTVRLGEEVSPAVRKWWSRSDHSDGSAEDACLTLSSMLLQDKETGFHRGFCWVGFTSEEGLNNALQKEPHVLEGAKVWRPEARPCGCWSLHQAAVGPLLILSDPPVCVQLQVQRNRHPFAGQRSNRGGEDD